MGKQCVDEMLLLNRLGCVVINWQLLEMKYSGPIECSCFYALYS